MIDVLLLWQLLLHEIRVFDQKYDFGAIKKESWRGSSQKKPVEALKFASLDGIPSTYPCISFQHEKPGEQNPRFHNNIKKKTLQREFVHGFSMEFHNISRNFHRFSEILS